MADKTASSGALAARLGKLNPFSKSRKPDDEDEGGEEIDEATVVDHESQAQRSPIRASSSIVSFLVRENILSREDAALHSADQPVPALQEILDRPHFKIPRELLDRSHPLPDYFVSSSHNTYLLSHQLYGKSNATAYETALRTGSRCVEIDAWDNDDNKEEPKVTHGYTLVSHISFRAVCETITEVIDKEAALEPSGHGYRAAPILLSLENHCGPFGQARLVQIMKEVFGDRLLSAAVRQQGHEEQQGSGDHVQLDQLGSKIAVIVEYHFPGEPDSSDSDDSSSSDESDREAKDARKSYKATKKAAPATIIIPELAELGVYAQSVKPPDSSWFEAAGLRDAPHHQLINVSESSLATHLPAQSTKVAQHNARHLMRVFPKGTRISSKNLHPVPFWGVGAQICALNWQTYNVGMQLNDALFSGTDGYVLKPAILRAGHVESQTPAAATKRKLRLHVAGATDIPVAADRDNNAIRPYLTCTLVHPNDITGQDLPKRKTAAYKQHKLTAALHSGDNPPPTSPFWDEKLEWEYEDNELVFLRLLIKSDDSYARNPVLCVSAVRLLYVVPGWQFIQMLDLKGRHTQCSLLVRFDFDPAPPI